MKKTYRSFFCLLAVLLLSVSALPAASALFSERLYYYGTVEEPRCGRYSGVCTGDRRGAGDL